MFDQSGSHPRSPELRSRPALETEARGQGMETSPSSGESHMAEVRTNGCGSVCFEHDYTLPALVRPVSPVTSRSGCSGPRMAQNQAVCFSPCLTALSNYIQNSSGENGALVVSSSMVAYPVVVFIHGQSVGRPSFGDSPQT